MELHKKIQELGKDYEIAKTNNKIHILYKGVSIITCDRRKGVKEKTIEAPEQMIEIESRKYDREYEIMSFINYPVRYIKYKIKLFFKNMIKKDNFLLFLNRK